MPCIPSPKNIPISNLQRLASLGMCHNIIKVAVDPRGEALKADVHLFFTITTGQNDQVVPNVNGTSKLT